MDEDIGRVDVVLERFLPDPNGKDAAVSRLLEAMRYAVLGGGKRLRPRLVYAAGRIAGAAPTLLDYPAAAVELIHAFSLIHDDLPAIDDDDLRRGQPTVHVRYDEATAILAGDALLALAFEVVGNAPVAAATALRWVHLLAAATGTAGMIGGQMIDIGSEKRTLALSELERLHRLKSGALIGAAVMAGAAAGELSARERCALERFGQDIGLAFQIQDDVLDASMRTEVLGKRQGSDERRGKSTYVSLMGGQPAAREALAQLERALRHLTALGERGEELAVLAEQLVRRDY